MQVTLRAVNRSVGRALPPRLLSRRFDGVPGRIHVDDLMLTSDAEEHLRHYVEDALSALHNLEETLAEVGRSWGDVQACLDFGSGYGRVTRWLAARLGPRRVTAADADHNAVRFCAAEFGVRPLVVSRRPAALSLPPAFDLVFAGSVLTHLREQGCLDLLRALAGAVVPGGLLVVSTQGESCLAHLGWYGHHFASKRDEFAAQLDGSGTAFAPYPGQPEYGIALHAERRFRAMLETACAGFRLVRFAPRGWDRHQDVWSVQRPAWPISEGAIRARRRARRRRGDRATPA